MLIPNNKPVPNSIHSCDYLYFFSIPLFCYPLPNKVVDCVDAGVVCLFKGCSFIHDTQCSTNARNQLSTSAFLVEVRSQSTGPLICWRGYSKLPSDARDHAIETAKQIFVDSPLAKSPQVGGIVAPERVLPLGCTDTLRRQWHLIFHVTDVDALYDRALAAGCQPTTAPRDAEWGERFFHLIDPDGHELSFARPLLPV
jgi:predicted enzyme related to lactoylglutathione lyase